MALLGSGMGTALALAADPGDVANIKACGSTPGPITETRSVVLPAADVDSEVQIGEAMMASLNVNIRAGQLILERGLTITGEGAFGRTFDVVIPPGPLQLVNGAYRPVSATFKYRGFGNFASALGAGDLAFNTGADGQTLIAKLSFGLVHTESAVDPSAVTRSEPCATLGTNGFRHELVYTGTFQGTVTLLYREFINDLARPAFSQELHYDLRDGDEIGFRGARLKVIKASNTSVQYRVLKPLDPG